MTITMLRTMDSQGRLIIPADIRKKAGIHSDSPLEISTNGEDIHIRKCSACGLLGKETEKLLKILYSNIGCGLALCTSKQIIFTRGVYFLNEAEITDELRAYVSAGEELIFPPSNPPCYPTDGFQTPVAAVFPVRGSVPGALLLLPKQGQKLTDSMIGCTRLATNVISNTND